MIFYIIIDKRYVRDLKLHAKWFVLIFLKIKNILVMRMWHIIYVLFRRWHVKTLINNKNLRIPESSVGDPTLYLIYCLYFVLFFIINAHTFLGCVGNAYCTSL